MKNSMLILISIFCLLNGYAQEKTEGQITEGTVVYKQTVKLEIQLEGDASQFADMLPKEQTSQKVLYFNSSAAMFENYNEKTDDGAGANISESEGVMIQMKMVEPDNKTFTDLKKHTQIEQREFMSRMFLINKKPSDQECKFTGNTKKILDFNCMEAWYTNEDDKKVTVWFTPEIPVPAGPGKLGGLPGLILAVDIDNGQRIIMATFVNTTAPEKEHFKKPKKGKKVSDEEYQAIVDEKMKEMGAEGGSGSGTTTIIKIGN